MGITWGLWTSATAQRRANYVCAAFGIILAIIGLGALAGMSNPNLIKQEATTTHVAGPAEESAVRVSAAQGVDAARLP
jgi:hypothetical protein